MAKRKNEALPPSPCKNVQEYEKSQWWKNKSKKLLENKELICPFCGRPRWVWQPRKKVWKRNVRFVVHHKNYFSVPYEKDTDLLVCCWTCHDIFHAILRLERMGFIFKELATIVRKYFIYETGSAGQNNYLNGKEK